MSLSGCLICYALRDRRQRRRHRLAWTAVPQPLVRRQRNTAAIDLPDAAAMLIIEFSSMMWAPLPRSYLRK